MNKTPGIDSIPAEIYKFGGERLTQRLHKLWNVRDRTLSQVFKDVNTIHIYCNKDDHRDCGNYRGISLLSIAGKIMAKIV